MSSKLENLLLKSKTPIKNNVYLISNVFPIETHKKIYNDLMNSENWGLLQTSNIDSQESKFWINSLGGYKKKTKYIQYSKFYEYDLYNRIVQYAYEVLKNKYEYDIDLIPIEIYANGQSKGQSGNWHQDSTNENLWTFLYYVNTDWTNPHWGGYTHFADSVENILSNSFKPNNGVLFNGTVWHYGEDPSIYSNKLRITLAYKLLIVKKNEINYLDFIKKKSYQYKNHLQNRIQDIEYI